MEDLRKYFEEIEFTGAISTPIIPTTTTTTTTEAPITPTTSTTTTKTTTPIMY